MSKYLFDETDISKEFIILISVFNASNANHKLLDPLSPEKLFPIYYTEWKIIQENIISTAIKLRIIDDQFLKHKKDFFSTYKEIGTLIKNNNKVKKLNFREACNKIIHATEFLPKTYGKRKIESEKYFQPKIELKGTYQSKEWKAVLDIKKYVTYGLSLLKQYDNDWDINAR